MDFTGDVDRGAARRAFTWSSMVPEERGDAVVAGYGATLTGDWEALSKLADTDAKRATLAEEFARYRAGYRARFSKWLASRSRCASSMVTGPSGFPARRMEKRNAVEAKRSDELEAFRTRALAAIRKALCPELRPIMTGDADAVERLEAKLAKDRETHARMKAVNAAMRKAAKAGPEAMVAAMMAAGGIPEKMARELLTPDFAGRLGFPGYELTNLAARIRDNEKRLAALKVMKAEPTVEMPVSASGIRVEDSPADNRVRLFFPGKPDEATRAELKRLAFRWTPSLGCWQAMRNTRTLEHARKVGGA